MSKTRTATLRVAHQRGCPNATRSSLDSLEGCTCKRAYYVHWRDPSGRAVKGPRVRDRQVADRALRKKQVELDEGAVEVGHRPRAVLTFSAWADEHLVNLDRDKGDRGSTLRAYESTFGYARSIFGARILDDIGQPEMRRFVRALRENGAADGTVHKHLRHLRATLTAAVDEGYARGNPLTAKFVRDLRLRVPDRVESYSDIELAKLFAQMNALEYQPVYIYVVKALLATGARVSELIAADWDDLDLGGGELHIRRSWDPVDGPTPPKDGEERTVYLFSQPAEPDRPATPALIDGVALFESWTKQCGVLPGTSPLFPAPRGERLNRQYVARLVIKARDKAGIPKMGEGGRERKPLHALRASYSRISREAGFPQWLRQANLGHATPDLTDATYGQIGIDALRAAARRQPVTITN